MNKHELRFENGIYDEQLEVRAVSITSPRSAIINLFAYPLTNCSKPVFALEFVEFGQRGIVAVIDIYTPQTHHHESFPYREMLHHARDQHPDLSYSEDFPDWYRDCRSGDDIFVRPQDNGEFIGLAAMAEDIWSNYLRQIPFACSDQQRQLAHADIQEYKHHHCANSPGKKLLKKVFGEQWASEFLTKYHFS